LELFLICTSDRTGTVVEVVVGDGVVVVVVSRVVVVVRGGIAADATAVEPIRAGSELSSAHIWYS
jgi:hypothetical protein